MDVILSPTATSTHSSAILRLLPMGAPWQTLDPFLFCMHHQDAYPAGNDQLGPSASLAGRNLGQDFEGKDGWRMYHGEVVPGFPAHPHCGFETVTIVRRGLVDHADSLGATARYGQGDVQWLTAGRGIQHSEMFPLLDPHAANPLELFQIWLNLPSASKAAAPHFTMFWEPRIPRRAWVDDGGRRVEVCIIAGALEETRPLAPPPESWAAHPDADVAIWTVRLEPRARWNLPSAASSVQRALYPFRGSGLRVDGVSVERGHGVQLRPEPEISLEAGAEEIELVFLQGRPIGEPVVQYGPFVGNSPADIQHAVLEYRRNEFGGWPWARPDYVHPREQGRFARQVDGKVETP